MQFRYLKAFYFFRNPNQLLLWSVISIVSILSGQSGAAQTAFGYDTIRIMQYNLMYFNSPAAPCGNTTSTSAMRAAHISTLLDYVKPHIFGVNEMNDDVQTADYLLTNAVRNGNRTHYQRAGYITGPDIINNMVFYDPTKLRLLQTTFVGCSPRRVSIYSFEHVGTIAGFSQRSVSTKLHVLVAHLKAGSTTTDQQARASCMQNVMQVLNAQYSPEENYIFMGDLNLYTSAEDAWAKVTDNTKVIHFIDPVNQVGNWSNNSAFAAYHTQSTRLTSTGCFVGGGLDDRFDFILSNSNILQNRDYIQYISGSYRTIGQSGNLFNKALNDPSNTSAPTAVLDALYNTSDHLPVSLALRITLSTVPSSLNRTDFSILANPFTGTYTFQGNTITISNVFNTVSGVYKIFGTNSISLTGINTYLTIDGNRINALTLTGLYTISGAQMTLSLSDIRYSIASLLTSSGSNYSNATLTSPIVGSYTLTGTSIRIETGTNTLLGSVQATTTQITFTGLNYYQINATLSGVNAVTIVGLRTISGSNISIDPLQLLVSPYDPSATPIFLKSLNSEIQVLNPFSDKIILYNLTYGAYKGMLVHSTGVVVKLFYFDVTDNTHMHETELLDLPEGMYYLYLIHSSNQTFAFKILKRSNTW